MRIAVDTRPLCHTISGIGRYTQNVLDRLLLNNEHEWFIYSDRPLQGNLRQADNVHYRCLPVGVPLLGTALVQALYPLWCWQDQVEAFWAPGQHLPLLLPSGIRQLLTIHDLVWLEHPDTMSLKGRLLDRLFIQRGIRQADHVLTVSESTAEALTARLGLERQKLTVTHLAPTPLPANSKPEPPASIDGTRFLLFVGTLEPRKNLTGLLEAFRSLRQDFPDHKLVLCGSEGWGSTSVETLVSQWGLNDSVIITGHVTDKQLHGLYQQCDLLAMPSLYEGFGLPALEALAYGKPVVVSPNTEIARLDSPLIHVCEDTAPGSIQRALSAALSAPGIQAHPLDLSWDHTAATTLKSLINL